MVTTPKIEIEGLKYSDFSNMGNIPAANYSAIRNAIRNIFTIRKGTLIGYPEFGTEIPDYLFTPNVTNSQILLNEITARLMELDPRVSLSNTSYIDHDSRGYKLNIEVEIKDTLETISVTDYIEASSIKD